MSGFRVWGLELGFGCKICHVGCCAASVPVWFRVWALGVVILGSGVRASGLFFFFGTWGLGSCLGFVV